MNHWLNLQLDFKQALQDKDETPLLEQFSALSNLTAGEGFAVYRDAFFLRMREFLEEDFSLCFSFWSEPERKAIIYAYIKKNPSSYSSGVEFGRDFPAFLGERKLSPEKSFLPDLAKLEWALVRAFYADKSEHQDFSGLETAIAEDWLEARFYFDPALQLFESDWPITEIYETAQAPTKKVPQKFIVYREEGEAVYRECSAEEFLFLAALHSGLTVGEVLRHHNLQKINSENFSTWISSGLLQGIRFSASPGIEST